MLDSTDFIELEKKYNLYKRKKNAKIYIFASMLFATLVVITISIITLNISNSKEKIAKNDIEQIKEVSQAKPKQKENKTKPISKKTETIKQNPVKPKQNIPENSNIQIGELNLSPIAIKKTIKPKIKPKKEQKEQIIPPPTEEKIVLNEQNTSIINEPKKENKIQISTTDINTIDQLKQKCNYTNDSNYCSKVAEKLYEEKDYKEAIKYALKANSNNSENEKSWIIFAKSKAKLGHKNDAIKILQTYLSSTPSKNAELILEKIKRGNL